MAEAEHVLGRLDEAADRLDVRPALVRTTLVRDARSSVGLSGVTVGLREALAADLLASQGTPPSGRSAPSQLVAAYLRAYDHGVAQVREGALVVDEMAAIMAGNTAPDAHPAGSPGDPVEDDQPRIAGIALAHCRLEVLRPFPAHVARAFSALELVRRGLVRDQVLPLSVRLAGTLTEYRRRIRAVEDTGSPHLWVDFFATTVREQALAQLRLIARLESLSAEYARLLPRSGILPRVAAELIGFPVVNHRAVRDLYGVTTKAATDLTRRLVDLRILRPWESRGYRRLFVCRDVLALLTNNPHTT